MKTPVRLTPCSGLRRCAVAACLLALAPFARAADIVGQVVDSATGTYLPNAAVTVGGSSASATADSEGRFRLSGLAAGTYRVQASNLGYDDGSATVTVGASGDASVTVKLSSGIQKMSAFVVEGFLEGRAKALQQKRTAENIMDIVSADSVGNLPDRNVAEAVARVPGLNLTGLNSGTDQGEGRYVSIRGAEPNLNQVMMDGATMAAPGGGRLGRAVPLDTLSAGQVSSIEVIKSVTPDLDANAVGGTINVRSASAFDRKGRFISGTVAGAKNGNTDQNNIAAQLSYSDLFGAKNDWGFAASASYDKRNYQNEWAQVGWSLLTLGGTPTYLPNDFEIKPEWGSKSRRAANANIEFRPDATTQFFFRPGYSHTENPETRFEIIYSPTVSAAAVNMTGPRTGTFIGNNRTERRAFVYESDQGLVNLSGGFKKILGAFTLEPLVSYSHATENRPYTHDREFRNANGQTGPIRFDLGNGFVPVSWEVDPAIDVPSRYPLRRTRDDWGNTDEKIYTAKADVRWDSSDILGKTGYLKTGFKYLQRKRIVDDESRRLIPTGAAWNLADTGAQLPSRSVYDGRFQTLFLPNAAAIDPWIASHPAQVTHDLAAESANSIENDYNIAEFIYGSYAMGSIKLGQLRVVGGVRWEKTSATIRADEERTINGAVPVRIPKSGTADYSKWFPSIQGVYRLSDQAQIRAAYTQTIGRPGYEDARPLAILNYSSILNPTNPQFGNTGSVTVGNPKLKPYGSKSFDVSLEWYGKKGGTVVSLAGFRKNISDPIYPFVETQQNVVYSGVGMQTLSFSSKLNGTSGRITGVEFTVHQPFRFLPSPFDGFGIDGNLTEISSQEIIPTRPGEVIPFYRQPSHIRNLTLFYEKYGVSARIAYASIGEQVNSFGSNLLQDRYNTDRKQYDAQVRYRFTKNYSFTFAVRNLTREPDNLSYGIKNLVQSSRLLDRDYKLSLDFNF